MPIPKDCLEEIESATNRIKEECLRRVFLEEATVTNIEKGYVSVPFVNQLINLELQSLASDLIAFRYRGSGISKVVMVPNSGNPLATTVAERLGTPLAIGRKGKAIPGSWSNPIVVTESAKSFTTGEKSQFVFNGLERGDKVLVVDDVIAHGDTSCLILEEFEKKGVDVVGLSVYFAKLFQPGVQRVKEERGIDPFYVVGIERLNEDGSISLSPPHF
jgi:xanthine phosphoribosyltransferase